MLHTAGLDSARALAMAADDPLLQQLPSAGGGGSLRAVMGLLNAAKQQGRGGGGGGMWAEPSECVRCGEPAQGNHTFCSQCILEGYGKNK